MPDLRALLREELEMNKILLSVATTVAVVGGTALAASIPIHVSTTTYKPGTPASMTYKGSPDEVGQSSTGGTNTANTPASSSTSASGTAASPTSSQMGPTQPAIPGATNPYGIAPSQYDTVVVLGSTMHGGQSWNTDVWRNIEFVVPSNATRYEPQRVHTLTFEAQNFSLRIADDSGPGVFGSSWGYDSHHVRGMYTRLYGHSLTSMGYIAPGVVQFTVGEGPQMQFAWNDGDRAIDIQYMGYGTHFFMQHLQDNGSSVAPAY